MNRSRRFFSTACKVATALGALLTLAASQSAVAQVIVASDCNGGFKNVYMDNEPVCGFGTTQTSPFQPPSFVCIVPPGATPNDGNDVTPGGCNGVPNGTFLDTFFWLPPTTPGTYDMVLVTFNGGAFDRITILDSGGAPPTVDVAEIKGRSCPHVDGWRLTEAFGNYIDDAASAISFAYALATGDVIGAGVAAFGGLTGQPTDYNGAVLSIGGQIIANLAGAQAFYYERLCNDPPDPNFTDIVPVDIDVVNDNLAAAAPLYPGVPLAYPFSKMSDDPLHLSTIELANSMAKEAALINTLMKTLEKFQGAEDADDDEFTLVQARALKNYSDQLLDRLAITRQGLVDYKSGLADDGVADVMYDGADIAAIVDRLMTSGLTPEEEQSLRNAGFGDADIQVLFDRIAAFPVPTGSYTRTSGIDGIIATHDTWAAGVQTISTEAQEVIDHFEPMVTLQHPSADAGGPYTDLAGAVITFDATGSTDPQGQTLTYEWDFDLDGNFDDATGASASNSYGAPVVTQVGLKVTDTDGNEDISYASVTVTEANGAPVITAFAPVGLAPTASTLSPLDFSASAMDPDMDPLVYEWRVDGAVMSNNQNYTYTPGVGETGTRAVRLTVSDLNPLSFDAVETRVVLLLDEVETPDVVGFAQQAAEDAIVAAGLVVGNVDTQNSDTVPAGEVISQDPVGGTVVLAGSEVDLVVSLGPDDVTVPDVVGLSQAAAEADIIAADLTVGTVTTDNSDTVPAGDVISQNPTGGTLVQPGTAVDLVVSVGPADVSVPDVVGLSQAAAEADIIAADLTVGTVTTDNSDTVPAGDVISQNPTGGTLVQPGTAVDLVISDGPAVVTCPCWSDPSVLDAVTAANQLPGSCDFNQYPYPAGMEIFGSDKGTFVGASAFDQNGEAVCQLVPGGAVSGTSEEISICIEQIADRCEEIGSGPANIPVPNVVGLSQAAAEADILAANLAVGAVTTENSDTVPAGNVISQNPAGGMLVQAGTAVDLVISAGPADVAVPDIVGLSQAAAEADILAASLVVGNVTTDNSDTVPEGDVISQNPTGGTLVQPGSAVDLVVSIGPAGSPPDAPTGLRGRAKQLLVNFIWTGSDGATGYRVYRRLNSEMEFSEIGQTPFTAFSNKLLDDTMFADYYVTAENEFGESAPSETIRLAPVYRNLSRSDR